MGITINKVIDGVWFFWGEREEPLTFAVEGVIEGGNLYLTFYDYKNESKIYRSKCILPFLDKSKEYWVDVVFIGRGMFRGFIYEKSKEEKWIEKGLECDSIDEVIVYDEAVQDE